MEKQQQDTMKQDMKWIFVPISKTVTLVGVKFLKSLLPFNILFIVNQGIQQLECWTGHRLIIKDFYLLMLLNQQTPGYFTWKIITLNFLVDFDAVASNSSTNLMNASNLFIVLPIHKATADSQSFVSKWTVHLH